MKGAVKTKCPSGDGPPGHCVGSQPFVSVEDDSLFWRFENSLSFVIASWSSETEKRLTALCADHSSI